MMIGLSVVPSRFTNSRLLYFTPLFKQIILPAFRPSSFPSIVVLAPSTTNEHVLQSTDSAKCVLAPVTVILGTFDSTCSAALTAVLETFVNSSSWQLASEQTAAAITNNFFSEIGDFLIVIIIILFEPRLGD
jgi:hypothetical protein